MFQHPWFLILLLLAPLLVWMSLRNRRDPDHDLASVVSELGCRHLATATPLVANSTVDGSFCFHGGFACTTSCRTKQALVQTEGIAIELVVDRSGSMMALDFQIDGDHVDRLEAPRTLLPNLYLAKKTTSPRRIA